MRKDLYNPLLPYLPLPFSLATPITPTESSADYWPHGKKYHAFFALFGIVKYVCVPYIIPIDFVKT